MRSEDGIPEDDYEACLGLAWQGLSPCHRLLALLATRRPALVWRASRGSLMGEGVPGRTISALEEARRSFDAVDAEAQLARTGLRFVPFGSPWYPAEVGQLDLPPAGFFALGTDEAFERLVAVPRITVVGTRRASQEGLLTTQAFTEAFVARDIAVVSGMALGVDGKAHRAALENGGLTVAVLGCGADVVYPPRHRGLYESIAARGLVLSELPPGEAPARWTFPYRNRLLAALGDAVLVIEGSKTSGALQTADRALDLGRQVFSVPGSIFREGHSGCNLLLRQGATPAVEPATTVEDFLTQTRIERGRRRETPPLSTADTRSARRTEVALVAGARGTRILEALAVGPTSLDGLMDRTGLSVRDLGAGIAELELAGLVERAGPGVYIRAP